ncbi:ankyrin repeat-containing domain protein, partial [Coprinopsis sp. MPI-PUGE-AT-0042]
THPSEDELLTLYQRFSHTMLATFCVLDALDEAPPEIQLEILKKLASVNVKLFITSRPLRSVEVSFPQAHRFRVIARDQDIDLHIDKELSRGAGLRELLEHGGIALRNEIAASIKEKCGGMFLHASLQLEALRECTSVHEVQETLATFSTEIEDLYLDTWNRITSQARAKTVLLAKNVLLWVVTATRSLTVEELRHALATCPNTHRFDPSRLVPEGTLIGLCRGLVTVEEDTRLVRLVHYTAKEFLNRHIEEFFTQPHAHLSPVCMALLTDSGIQRQTFSDHWELQQFLQAKPLLSYAYDSWLIHVRHSVGHPPTTSRLAEFVQKCHTFPVQHQSLHEQGLSFEMLGPLHLAAFFNLPIAVAGIHNLRNPNRRSAKQKVTALHLAAMEGHDCAVKELLQLHNTLVNAVDIREETPLMWASAFGNEEATRLLVGRTDININGADGEGQTALIWASRRGHEGVVTILLSHPDIDVSMADRLGFTALSWASKQGHEGTVMVLRSHPNSVNSKHPTFHFTSLLLNSRFC